MDTPEPRHARRSEVEPYVEETTVHSSELADGQPARTYHVRRVDVGHGWSYQVSMEVVATQAAEDVLGRKANAEEGPRALWGEIWQRRRP